MSLIALQTARSPLTHMPHILMPRNPLTPLIPQSLILLDFSLGWCVLPLVAMQFCSPAPLVFHHPDLTPFVLVYHLVSSRFHFRAIPLLACRRALFSTSLDL